MAKFLSVSVSKDSRYNTAYNAIFSISEVIEYFDGYDVDTVKGGVMVSERLSCEFISYVSFFASEIAEDFYPEIADNPESVDSLKKTLRQFYRNCSDSSSVEIKQLTNDKTGQLLISFSRVIEGIIPGITIITVHISSTDPGIKDPDWSDWSYKFRASLGLIFFFDSDSRLIQVRSQHMEA
jgi:hypothetical protein